MMPVGSEKRSKTKGYAHVSRAEDNVRSPLSMTSGAIIAAFAPLVTLLRNTLAGSDQDHVRLAQGLAACGDPI